MNMPSLATPIRQPAAWMTFPAKVGDYFARLGGRFGVARNPAWACSFQPEHMLAYATWEEMLADTDGDSLDAGATP
jgi:hypothetical protein